MARVLLIIYLIPKHSVNHMLWRMVEREVFLVFTCAFMKWLVYVALIWSHVHCVDRHRFDADPDPTFHFDADQDPDPEPDTTPGFTYVGKSDLFYAFTHSSCSYLFLSFS
jgi:hypothetical protein